ncbi:MAG: DNA repair protein RadA [Clostridia bacterium]|nr:DNA repair protein RadA [Clostridia bacterium]
MPPKAKSVYVCNECGWETARWSGQCSSCGAWNTLQEELRTKTASAAAAKAVVTAVPKKLADIDETDEPRLKTNIRELDRVLGGGIVPGGLMLIGGDPGIGKSTLLLQVCATLGQTHDILYVSGEESARQIRLRASRLKVNTDRLSVLCENDMDTVLAAAEAANPDLLIIDSIQTMALDSVASSAGSVTQVRECTAAIMRTCKAMDLPVFIVGHVNKDGAIAGPKVMEHIVDCVLSFEGERHTTYRLLRCAKNRYGSTNEIGVFEMHDKGLVEVENPSQMLLAGRLENVSGTCIACTLEGTRPLLAEVQGLVTPTGFGNPRRMSTGFDYNRLNLILAVLEKRAGYFFSTLDVYINVVGGLRLDEPAADLAVALALVSGLKDHPLPHHAMAFGEVGLAGEIRAVTNAQARVNEAARLGFTHIVLPAQNVKGLSVPDGVTLTGVRTVREAYEAVN